MAAFTQFLYKYPTSDGVVSTFELGADLCDLISEEKVDIVSVGIQAPRGTKFWINGSQGVVGSTGKFELDKVIVINSLIIGTSADATYYSDIIVDILYSERA